MINKISNTILGIILGYVVVGVAIVYLVTTVQFFVIKAVWKR